MSRNIEIRCEMLQLQYNWYELHPEIYNGEITWNFAKHQS